ncbi:MAG: ATP-binding cassette domain-containing protein [Aquirufa sp.]|jgi:ABC-type multidrug transport system ATPase subunit
MLKISIPRYQVNPHFSLSNLKIGIQNGEIFTLVGKSGSGKSTVALLAVGLKSCPEASIIINDKELNNGVDRLIPQFKSAGYVPQNLHLKPHHTVQAYLEMLFQRMTEKERNKTIKYYIQLFHIQHLLESKINQLSGGERQKIALLESVSQDIEYLVLDEPFSQLDTAQKIEFIQIIQELINFKHIPCLLISHDLVDILKMSHKLGIIENGKMAFQGKWDKFWISKNKIAIRLKNAIFDWKKETDSILSNLI